MTRRFAIVIATVLAFYARAAAPAFAEEELYPKHVNAKVQTSVVKGLDYLAKTQGPDGNWPNSEDGSA